MVIWITGLPGAGKTTIAKLLFGELKKHKNHVNLLDGDELRHVFNNMQYDANSRQKLAFTYSRLAKLLSDQGSIAICSTVSMFDVVREWNAQNNNDYLEVYLKVPNSVLSRRNQKQLYSEAAKGEVQNVHGFDLAIEEPKNPDLVLCNDGSESPLQLVNKILIRLGLPQVINDE